VDEGLHHSTVRNNYSATVQNQPGEDGVDSGRNPSERDAALQKRQRSKEKARDRKEQREREEEREERKQIRQEEREEREQVRQEEREERTQVRQEEREQIEEQIDKEAFGDPAFLVW
jgi:hypothetical protein